MEQNKSQKIFKIIGLIVIVLIIIVALLIGYYFYKSNNPKTVFTNTINKYLDNYEESITKKVNTQNTTIDLGLNINTTNTDAKKIAEIINNSSVQLNTQLDYQNKKALAKISVNYENEKLVDGKIYYDSDEKAAYGYVENLFDKYFKIDLSSSKYNELNESLKDVFETQSEMKLGEKVSLKKANNILKKKIAENLNSEYFSKEKSEITIKEKTSKVNKFKMTLTQKQLVEMLQSIFNELSEDEEFLNCWEDKDNIKDSLTQISKSLDETEKNDDMKIDFNIYKKGILNEFLKFEVIAYQDDEQVSFSIIKENKNLYNFEGNSVSNSDNKAETITGKINIEKVDENTYKYTITTNIPDFGDITLNLGISNVVNKDIENIDKSNNVSVDELTTNDQKTIMNNLSKMKIYELISSLTGATSSSTTNNLISDTTLDNNTTLDDNTGIEENNENQNVDSSTSNTTNDQNTLKGKNIVKSYSENILVSYGVPSNFTEFEDDADNYKLYQNKEKEVDVAITVPSLTLEDFNSEIESKKEYYEESEYYENVKISDFKTFKVNDNEFKAKEISYTDSSSKKEYKVMYVFLDIDGIESYMVKIDNSGNITNSELAQFLNINIKK